MGFRKKEPRIRLAVAPAVFVEDVREVVPDEFGVNRVYFKQVTSEEIVESNLDADAVNPHTLLSNGESIPIPSDFGMSPTDATDVMDDASAYASQKLDELEKELETSKSKQS